MANPEEKKPVQTENDSQNKQPEHAGNWITDMYDKVDVPVKVLDITLVLLGALIVFLFVFGNKIQLGL